MNVGRIRLLGDSLRANLVGLLSLAVLAAAGLQAGLVYRLIRAQADGLFDRQMVQLAETLQDGGPSAPWLAGDGAGQWNPHAGFAIQVWDTTGACLVQNPAGLDLPATPFPGFLRARAGGREYRVYCLRSGDRLIKVAQDLDAREDLATGLAFKAVLPTLLLAPVLMLAVWLAVRRATGPVLRVRDQVSRRAAEDLSGLPVADLPAELRPLVEEINSLFTRLQAMLTTQREFVADAAHELRTPLAALRLQVQGLQRAQGEAARDQAGRRVLEGVDRASRLVEQLLVLARQEELEPSQGPAEGTQVDEVLARVLAEVLPAAQAKGLDLGRLPGPPVLAACPAEPLAILVRNLVENAVKYTPEGGTIDVSLATRAGLAVLTVEDSGPGIVPEQRERVFERFHRLPGQVQPGSGLGLAIVQAIVRRYRGTVVLGRSQRLGGLEATVCLPGQKYS